MKDMYDIDPGELLDFAKSFADLGDSIGGQVIKMIAAYQDNRMTTLDLNGNAIEMARERLGGKNEQLDEAFAEYAEIEARLGFDCDQDEEVA